MYLPIVNAKNLIFVWGGYYLLITLLKIKEDTYGYCKRI